MDVLLNKNYPSFNHRDTFLNKKTIESNDYLFTYKDIDSYFSYFNKTKKNNPLKKIFGLKTNNNYCDQTSNSNICLQNSLKNLKTSYLSRKKTKSTAFTEPNENVSKIISQNELLSKRKNKEKSFFDEKTEYFLNHLQKMKNDGNSNYLKKTIFFPKINKRSPTLKLPTIKSPFQIERNDKKKNSFDLKSLEKIESPRNCNILKKRGSLLFGSMQKSIQVREYDNLIEMFKKTSNNIQQFISLVSNSRKAYFILKNMISEKQKYLYSFFFIDGKELIHENISLNFLKQVFFKKEKSGFDNISIEEKMNYNLIQNDLKYLNQRIEEYLIIRHIDEYKYIEKNLIENLLDNVSAQYKEGEIYISDFNYEKMPEHSVIDDLIEMEKKFGMLNHCNEKEKILGKTIDNIIKNVKMKNKERGHIFKIID